MWKLVDRLGGAPACTSIFALARRNLCRVPGQLPIRVVIIMLTAVQRLIRAVLDKPTLQQPSHDREVADHPGSGLRRPDLVAANGFGLLVQGGGMRGVFTMGALAELHRQGLTGAFDLTIGNSAGAIALSYFVAGQADKVNEEYWAALRQLKIFHPMRFWRIVDVDRMVDEAMFCLFPLDVDAIRASPTRLLIGLTDVKYRLPSYVLAQELTEQDLRTALKASAALPGLFNRALVLNGRRYIDGGFVDTLPLFRLKMLGCERMVVVTTVPLEYQFVNDSFMRRTLIKTFALTHSRYVRTWIGTPNPLQDENLEALMLWSEDPQTSRILAIAPPHRLPDFTNCGGLHATFELGVEAARSALASVTWITPCE